jgi:sarcosine oxidase gamma subunit
MNWTSFSKLPFTRAVHDVVMALGLEIPPEGRPHLFLHNTGDGQFFSVKREGPDRWLIATTEGVDVGLRSQLATNETRKKASSWFLTKGTPSGDALRYWLALWEDPESNPG